MMEIRTPFALQPLPKPYLQSLGHFQTILPFHKPKLLPRRLVRFRSSVALNEADSQAIPQSAISRIAEKLRSLGYVCEDEDDGEKQTEISDAKNNSPGEIFIPLPKHLPKYRVGHTIDTSWSTPENPPVPEEKEKEAEKRKERVPTFAELNLPKKELQRLITSGIGLKLKLMLGKAGITEGIINGIHERWRNSELVKIACYDICRLNMQRTHDLLERKTGGQVIWRSGGKIILYRGANYKYPYFSAHNPESREDSFVPKTPSIVQGVGSGNRVRFQTPGELQMVEEADRMLDGLGPRFTNWYGCDPLPVDADLLPPILPGFRKPIRLLPYGIKSTLTNDEVTILKRLGRPLPCHFALSRNHNLQGLAASIVKLWEKSEIVKVAVKRGAQNANGQLMAEELKRLTGGSLLSRDEEVFVLYRGKDFLPAAVSSAIEDRRRNAQSFEKKTMSEDEEMKLKSTTEDAIERTSFKLETAEKLLDELEKEEVHQVPEFDELEKEEIHQVTELDELEKEEVHQVPEHDKQGLTRDESFMLRKIGLQMGPFLLLGKRGVFDGTIEAMHLHWKYRELVKIICGGRDIEKIHEVARVLEAESGGILIAVERVSKGFAIIVYRGKNYARPARLRPETLLNKRQALKQSVEAQRRESLKLHVLKLNESVDDLKLQLDKDKEEIMSQYPHKVDEPQTMDNDEPMLNEAMPMSGPLASSSDKDKDQDKEAIMSQYPHNLGNEPMLNEATSIAGPLASSSSVLCHDNHELDGAISFNSHILAHRQPGAPRLSNREKLELRKQALSLKKRDRPVLSVGKRNNTSGVTRTINTHFKKHPLAIVNIKGIAKGTSIQELVCKLEEETSSVLVSQEKCKVILYRGWGADQDIKAGRKSSQSSHGEVARPLVSPQLLMAMRIECGLLGNKKEQDDEQYS